MAKKKAKGFRKLRKKRENKRNRRDGVFKKEDVKRKTGGIRSCGNGGKRHCRSSCFRKGKICV